MRLVLIMAPGECLEEIQELVIRHDIRTFTEIPNVPGAGRTGAKLGTRAFPGTSSMLLTIVPREEVARITEAIREYSAVPENCSQVAVFALPAEQLL
jgi:hypothetical protein